MKQRTFDNRETVKGLLCRPENRHQVQRNKKQDYSRKGKSKFKYGNARRGKAYRFSYAD